MRKLPILCELRITYANGSRDVMPYSDYADAVDYARRRISYTGGKVARVALADLIGGGERALWDAAWTKESQTAGLAPSA